MIDIPLDKALVPVENNELSDAKIGCDLIGCCLSSEKISCRDIPCNAKDRMDGKSVIFRLVDYPVEVKK